ncbi:MAG: hypothetical protein ACXW27_09280 [Allosphingosinicella sp.]
MTDSKATDSDPNGIDAEDELVDDCVEDKALGEMEATLDVELPPARGGVEQPELPQS